MTDECHTVHAIDINMLINCYNMLIILCFGTVYLFLRLSALSGDYINHAIKGFRVCL